MAKLNVQGLSTERLKELQIEIKGELANRFPDPPPFAGTDAGKALIAKRAELDKALQEAEDAMNKANEVFFNAEEAYSDAELSYADAEATYLDEYAG